MWYIGFFFHHFQIMYQNYINITENNRTFISLYFLEYLDTLLEKKAKKKIWLNKQIISTVQV